LVHRQRALAGEVEGLLSGKGQETLNEEGKLSVKTWGLLKAVR